MPPARRGASTPSAPATPSQPPAAATPAAKPAARKPAARKPAPARTAAARSTASKSASKPAAARPAAAKTAAAKTAAAKPAAKRPAAKKPAASSAKTAAAKKDSGPVVKAAREAQTAAEERFEAVAKRLRKLNDQIIDGARDRGELTLDSYEKALKAIASGIEKGPGKSDIDWISNLATSQAKFIRELTKSWTDAARDAIKK